MSWASTLAMGQKFVKILRSLDINRRVERVHIENAIMSLRRITFYSSELTMTLQEIADGKEPDPDAVSYFAKAYAPDPEYDRENLELEYLDVLRFKTSQSLSILDLKLMSQVKYGKLDARRHIRQFFASYKLAAKTKKVISKREAKAVLAQIELLNRSIVELESILLKARKGEETSGTNHTGDS